MYVILPTPPKTTLKRGKSSTRQEGQAIYLYTAKNNPENVLTGSSISLSLCLRVCVRVCVCALHSIISNTCWWKRNHTRQLLFTEY